MLSKKQSEFVALIIQGTSPGEAYRQAFKPASDSPDSLRAMASRLRRNPDVAAAIRDGLDCIARDAIQGALWSERASIVARVRDLDLIDAEIKRRLDGLAMECEGIQTDPELSECEKKRLMGRAMEKALLARDLVSAKQAIYGALDALTSGTSAPSAFMPKLNYLLSLTEDPDTYTAPAPSPGA